MRRTISICVCLAPLWTAPGAEAKITAVSIDRIEAFAEGATFGETGVYERVIGTVKGELDPADQHNRGIVNVENAPRNARGFVEYETEFFMLRPANMAKGNGKVLYEVNNRGRKFLMHWLLDAPAQAGAANNDPRSPQDAGNGLVFRQGYTVVWSGWDPDAPRSGGGMAMRVPVAQKPSGPIVRTIRDELVNGTRSPLADVFKLSYEAASIDTQDASLRVRAREADAAHEIARDKWTFVDSRTVKLLPDGTKPPPGSIFELTYQAKDPKVLGIGFAATRDLVSFLRYESRDSADHANPAGPGIKAALGFGISQSGRYLRDFIGQGFNQDESRRKVFDGVLVHISGVGRVFLNDEFGQPARTNTQHEDHFYPENAFPFSTATLRDPVTGTSGSLFRGDGFDPLLIEVNTSTEYWQKGASLLTTDPLGEQDVDLPKNARVFMIAGTQHAGRGGLKPDLGPCANLRNPHNPAPALRALLVDLDQWVTKGIEPPASRVPRISDGTLVRPNQIGFPPIPGFRTTQISNALVRFSNWVEPSALGGPQYQPLVPRVDSSGNETAGILLPDIAAPLATFTGWNVYKSPFPDGDLCDRDGSYSPLAKTKAERLANGDPRPSLEERYGDHSGYVATITAAADDLVKARLLLPEDAEAYTAAARSAKTF